MEKIFLFLSIMALFLGFALNSAFSDDNRAGQNNTTVSPQCQLFISWFSDREQDLLDRLNSDKIHKRYGAAKAILEHPQTHSQQVVSRALDVAYEGKLYETIKGIRNDEIYLSGIENNQNNSCINLIFPSGIY